MAVILKGRSPASVQTPASGKHVLFVDGGTVKVKHHDGSVTTEASLDDLTAYQATAEKGQPDGYASLDGAGKVPSAQLTIDAMEYKGTWNAATNSPALADGSGNAGDLYRVSAAGDQDLGSGNIAFAIGDEVVYSGSVWQRTSGTARTPEFFVDTYGARGDGSTDNSEAIIDAKVAAVAAGGGVLVFGPGIYRYTDPAALNIGANLVSVRGQGMEVTILKPAFGTSTDGYGIFHDDVPGGGPPYPFASRFIRDLSIEGPGQTNVGAAPHNKVIGLRVASRMLVENVHVRYCKYGIEVYGEHAMLKHVQTWWCYFGAYWPGGDYPSGDTATGDTVFLGGVLHGAMANIGVGLVTGGGVPPMHDVTFHHTHLGFSPYCFFLEGTDHSRPAINNVSMEQSHFESFGNGVIYGPGRRIETMTIRDCYGDVDAAWHTATYHNSDGSGPVAAPRDALIDVWLLYDVVIDSPDFGRAALDEGIIKIRQDAGGYMGAVHWKRADTFIHTYLPGVVSGGKHVVVGGPVSGLTVEWSEGYAELYSMEGGATVVAGGAVNEGPYGSASNVDPNPGGFWVAGQDQEAPIGLAMEDGVYPENILVCKRGLRNGKASGAITRGDPLVEAGLTGKLKSAKPELVNLVRTNLIKNPSFEVDATGWTSSADTHGVSSAWAKSGAQSYHVIHHAATEVFTQMGPNTHGTGAGEDSFAVTPGDYYALQASFHIITNPAHIYALIQFWTFSGGFISQAEISTTATGDVDLSTVGVVPAGAAWARVDITSDGSGSREFYFDDVMLEQAAGVRSYFDGSFPMAAWSGTAHESTSTRTDPVLTVYDQTLGMALTDAADGAAVSVDVRL